MSTDGVEQENQTIEDKHLMAVCENNGSQPSLTNHHTKNPALNELDEDQKKAAQKSRKNEARRLRYRNMTTGEKKDFNKRGNDRKRQKMENDPIYKKTILARNAKIAKCYVAGMAPEKKLKYNEKRHETRRNIGKR